MVKPGVIRKIKKSKNYTYAELARLTGKCEGTVRGWARDGMRVLTSGRPHIILGSDARVYLERRFQAKRPKLKIGQARCFQCRAPKMIEAGLAEIIPKNPRGWCLRGLCIDCGGMCSRWIAARDIPLHAKKLSIQIDGKIQAYSGPSSRIQTYTSEGLDLHA